MESHRQRNSHDNRFYRVFKKKSADTKVLPCKTIGELYCVDGKKFQRQYKKSISDYKNWDQKLHAEHYVLFFDNLSTELSLDEVASSDGELYTVLTSKKTKGRKGSVVAIIIGTKSEIVIHYLIKISRKLRLKVHEITLDMAGPMKLITKEMFSKCDTGNRSFLCSKTRN